MYPLSFENSLAQASVRYGIAMEDMQNQESLDYVLKFQPLERVEHAGNSHSERQCGRLARCCGRVIMCGRDEMLQY